MILVVDFTVNRLYMISGINKNIKFVLNKNLSLGYYQKNINIYLINYLRDDLNVQGVFLVFLFYLFIKGCVCKLFNQLDEFMLILFGMGFMC